MIQDMVTLNFCPPNIHPISSLLQLQPAPELQQLISCQLFDNWLIGSVIFLSKNVKYLLVPASSSEDSSFIIINDKEKQRILTFKKVEPTN